MKVEIYLADKILEFKLPNVVSGSFSFGDDTKKLANLVSIEAIDDRWYFISTEYSSIIKNNTIIEREEVLPNKFYTLQSDGKTFLVYIDNLYDDSLLGFHYDEKVNIVFGNNNNCNIYYNYKIGDGEIFRINYQNNQLVMQLLKNALVYINNKIIKNNTFYLKPGDQIKYYGLKMIVLKNIIFINNPNNLVTINSFTSKLSSLQVNDVEELNVNEIENNDLYDESDYFSKSPRLKRFIETKNIKLDPPPKDNTNNEMPLLMVIGPMMTMAITSMITIVTVIVRIINNTTTIGDALPQLLIGLSMIMGSLSWPLLTNRYQKKQNIKKRKKLEEKYTKYLQKNEDELKKESMLQRAILIENLVSLRECIDNINKRGILFWNKRNDENDFLLVRVGVGNEKLNVKIDYPEEGFTLEEDELKKQTEQLIKKYKYIENVPIGFSLYDNVTTAIMGDEVKRSAFVNNIILQLLTFYSYEDLKIVVITNKKTEHYWDYIKYLNHNFSNDKEIRFFGSDEDSIKDIAMYLDYIVKGREGSEDASKEKPYYVILVDNYQSIKKYDFVKIITESENNLGFSLLICENKLSKLPSKCNNFISLVANQGSILKNTYDSQEIIPFNQEIDYSINMEALSKLLANIPIEFEDGVGTLPETISFLEMEEVGKVEQLNILNRWNTNNPTESLRAEVGIDENLEIMYLDLHEKYHGPHGLIAGTTGSGKSEFIITYILSMCINYSPEYVNFILIDYKGGGLAGAFENKVTGVYLPHLAGIITNLDKAEMDRTLVSIDSELKKRQEIFNNTRDKLGESTIDIYKYQRLYLEGKVDEAMPHLFIICDEFAELKAQQPEFMDNLISVARIGRSLGVHLILATQKPTGVVNDQIWSNTKFRVCFKVANTSDSNEMLKKPDAAYIKQTGRFYLQVGMDELFELGQSAWCGAKYFPSNQIIEQVDNSINFIDNSGRIIKSIVGSSNKKNEAKGEQVSAVLKEIISVSDKIDTKAHRLWLENIPELILIDNIIKKYNYKSIPYNIEAVLGEYDAPELQEQGIVKYNYLKDGNTIIYGLDSSEREMLLNTLIYSTIISHSPEEINYYILDYGSEALRMFSKFPHIGGMVFAGDDEKYNNLFKLVREFINERKKILFNYGGDFSNYNRVHDNKLSLKVFILNNYDSIYENNQNLYEILPDLVRDSERYGIIFILTANSVNSVSLKIEQNFNNIYAFKLKDQIDYNQVFNSKKKIIPRDIFGRGLFNNGDIHEFQTCSILDNNNKLNDYLLEMGENYQNKYSKVETIPELPDQVDYNLVKDYIKSINEVPIGMSKNEIELVKYDFTLFPGTIISSNRILNSNKFILSLLVILSRIPKTNIFFIDAYDKLLQAKDITKNYYNNQLDVVIDKITDYLNSLNNTEYNQIVFIYGLDKLLSKLPQVNDISKLFDAIRKNDKYRFIIADDASKLKQYSFEQWFFKNISLSDGIWVGRGLGEQNLFKIGLLKKEYMANISNDFGYYINEGIIDNIKLIDFTKKSGDNHEK